MNNNAIAEINKLRDNPHESLSYNTWVSQKYKYLYTAIQKVASSKIKLVLHELECYEAPDSLAALHDRSDKNRAWLPRLTDLPDEKCLEILSSDLWFRFAFVRNPYSRLLSAYKSRIMIQDPDKDEHRTVRENIRARYHYPHPSAFVIFKDFVKYVCEIDERADGHWAPQSIMLQQDLVDYDYIGRYENFELEFANILRRLEAPDRLFQSLSERVFATTPIALAAVYDRKTADLVYGTYEDDFRQFGYKRDSWLYI